MRTVRGLSPMQANVDVLATGIGRLQVLTSGSRKRPFK